MAFSRKGSSENRFVDMFLLGINAWNNYSYLFNFEVAMTPTPERTADIKIKCSLLGIKIPDFLIGGNAKEFIETLINLLEAEREAVEEAEKNFETQKMMTIFANEKCEELRRELETIKNSRQFTPALEADAMLALQKERDELRREVEAVKDYSRQLADKGIELEQEAKVLRELLESMLISYKQLLVVFHKAHFVNGHYHSFTSDSCSLCQDANRADKNIKTVEAALTGREGKCICEQVQENIIKVNPVCPSPNHGPDTKTEGA